VMTSGKVVDGQSRARITESRSWDSFALLDSGNSEDAGVLVGATPAVCKLQLTQRPDPVGRIDAVGRPRPEWHRLTRMLD